mgnify:CR=1 FL=1
MTSVTKPEQNGGNGFSNEGPWWSGILNNRNAVIAVVALYLMYFFTQTYDTSVAHLAAQVDRIDTSLVEHREADRNYNAKLIDLLTRLNDQAVIQTRVARLNCWNSSKTNEARMQCYDQNPNPGVR